VINGEMLNDEDRGRNPQELGERVKGSCRVLRLLPLSAPQHVVSASAGIGGSFPGQLQGPGQVQYSESSGVPASHRDAKSNNLAS
jgi:hypothetical protein